MNETYTREARASDSSDSDKDLPMPVSALIYSDEESDSDDAGETGGLPAESASLGKAAGRPTRQNAIARSSKPTEKNPPFAEMIVEAITEINDRKGASVPAIKTKMRKNYDISEVTMKTNFKRAIMKGVDSGTLLRPASSKENKGVTGRFKVNPDLAGKKTKTKEKKEGKESRAKQVKTLAKVDKKSLKSLEEKSLAVKAAKEKIKQARRSVGLAPTVKPRAAPRKLATNIKSGNGGKPISPKAKPLSAPTKRPTRKKASESVEVTGVTEPQLTARAGEGAKKKPAKKAAPAKKKIPKAK